MNDSSPAPLSGPHALPSAAERLAASRARLLQTMQASMPPARAQHPPGELPAWLHGIAEMPVVAAVLEAVRGWWSHHPMRLATLVASDAGKTLIRPLAQRHPLALILGALIVGGLLVRVKPWRGLLKPALFAGLLPQIMSKVMAHVPVQSWLSVLTTFTEPPSSTSSSSPPRNDAQAPEPASAERAPGSTLH
ncbi:MAG TPA: hypothetical protein VFL64_07175 [Rhizobacter sp.]|nr:hypothetical protein [Rhizobacter sp.]